MGNFYKDKERVLKILVRPMIRRGCTRDELHRAVRLSPYGFGQRITDQIINDLVESGRAVEEDERLSWRGAE